jgi:hypothetical protein
MPLTTASDAGTFAVAVATARTLPIRAQRAFWWSMNFVELQQFVTLSGLSHVRATVRNSSPTAVIAEGATFDDPAFVEPFVKYVEARRALAGLPPLDNPPRAPDIFNAEQYAKNWAR